MIQKLKKILLVFAWLLAGGVIIMLSGAAVKKRAALSCKYIKIEIEDKQGNTFVDEEEIQEILKTYTDTLIGCPLDKLNLALLEKKIEVNPYIDNAEIYLDVKGDLTIEIQQRHPLVRVINNKDVSYYIDEKGERMPVCPKFAARVPVANGFIPDEIFQQGKITDPLLRNLYELSRYIDEDPFWKAQVEQIYVNEKNEFEIIPKLGDHVIQIGSIVNLDEKLKKMLLFYQEGLKHVGWNRYKIINLNYKDQIVCVKK